MDNSPLSTSVGGESSRYEGKVDVSRFGVLEGVAHVVSDHEVCPQWFPEGQPRQSSTSSITKRGVVRVGDGDAPCKLGIQIGECGRSQCFG